MITFLLMNFTVGVSAFLFTYKILKFKNFVDSILSLSIIYFAQIILSELILGIIGSLFLREVILVNLVILLIIYSITKSQTSTFSLSGVRLSVCELLKNKVLLFGVSAILGFGLVKICINLTSPPFGWDCLNYHFTFPVEWLKQGSLNTPIVISCDPNPSYYPINGSLFFLWLIFPFKNVFLADLGQVTFFILAFLAVYSISKKIGLNEELSFYSAALFLITPNVFKQLEIAYVDVILAALFLVCLNYLFSLNKEFSLANVLIYSMSLGLLIGTKTVGLPYSALLLVPFVYLSIKNINKSYLFIITIFAIIILGGFTYIRNFLQTNNPLYPLDFNLFGRTIFKGVTNINFYIAHYKPQDYRLAKLLFHEGLGAQTLIFILPAVFLGLPITLIKGKRNLNFIFIYFLVLPLLIYAVYYYIIPFKTPRYLYPLLGSGLVIFFHIAKLLKIPKIILRVLISICFIASAAELASHAELVFSAVFTILFIFLFFWIVKKGPQINLRKTRFLVFTLLIIFIVGLVFLEKDYRENEYARYISMEDYSGFWPDATRAWKWLNDNTQESNIAYIGRPVPFPLYGRDFKNNVYYVSLNKIDPVKLHYFPNAYYTRQADYLTLHENLRVKGNYRSGANYSVWLENLKKRNSDYLFIYSLHQTRQVAFPIEDAWASGNPEKFDLVFSNNTIHIYKLKK